MEEIKKGQIWKYETRPGEESSLIIILKVEKLNNEDVVVHAQVTNLKIKDFETGQIIADSIGHLPMHESSFRKSVFHLIGNNNVELEGSGYEDWQYAYKVGNAGIWDIEVADVINTTEISCNIE
jgi:hypothetical protein